MNTPDNDPSPRATTRAHGRDPFAGALRKRRARITTIAVPAFLIGAGLAAWALRALQPKTAGDSMLDASSAPNAERLAVAPVAMPKPTPRPPDQRTIPAWAQGKVILQVPVRARDKVFALTFDDGPWPEYTREMLAVLAANKVKATFYMVGQEVSRRPEIAREVLAAGHAIGNHSWDHPSRPRNPIAQIQKTDAEIKKQLGFRPTTFRPPYGLLKNGMAKQAMRENDPVLIWSADSGDWGRPGASRIANRIISQATPGGISLMHDGGGDRSQSVAALPRIIQTLRARGYRFVTIPELLRLRYLAPPKPKAAKIKGSKTPKRKTPRSGTTN